MKMLEMEYLLENGVDVLVLVETHCRGNKFVWGNEYTVLEQQRNLEDKGGSDLLVAMKNKEGRKLSKKDCEEADIIEVEYEDIEGKKLLNVPGYDKPV